jgi:hypothetical protein
LATKQKAISNKTERHNGTAPSSSPYQERLDILLYKTTGYPHWFFSRMHVLGERSTTNSLSFQQNPTAACEVLQDVCNNISLKGCNKDRTCEPLSPDFSAKDAHLQEIKLNFEC